jgi:hypothetical protein
MQANNTATELRLIAITDHFHMTREICVASFYKQT